MENILQNIWSNYLEGLIKQNGIENLMEMEPVLVSRLSEFVKGSRELNTFGYVKLRSKKLDKALNVFDINTKIFPYRDKVFDNLGEAFFITKEYTLAIKNYKKLLELNPKDENALKMLEEIKMKLIKLFPFFLIKN